MRQKLELKSKQTVLMLLIKLNQSILNKEKKMHRVYHYQSQNKLHMMHFMMFQLQPRKMRLKQKLKSYPDYFIKYLKFQLLQPRKMRLRQKLKNLLNMLKKKLQKFQLLQPRKMKLKQKLKSYPDYFIKYLKLQLLQPRKMRLRQKKYLLTRLLKRKLKKFQLLLPRKMKLRQKPIKRSIIIISIIRKSIKRNQILKFQLLQPRKMKLKQKQKSYPD